MAEFSSCHGRIRSISSGPWQSKHAFSKLVKSVISQSTVQCIFTDNHKSFISPDEDICWELVENLAAKGLVWYSAIDEANTACKAQQPFSLEDLSHALHTSALHAKTCLDNSMRVELGPLHVLRARLNEVNLPQAALSYQNYFFGVECQ